MQHYTVLHSSKCSTTDSEYSWQCPSMTQMIWMHKQETRYNRSSFRHEEIVVIVEIAENFLHSLWDFCFLFYCLVNISI
ncbi:hypothetical protein Glove_360g166 [Diversispora epigaea]|uniref:Uncharacterized protein n=1 Tax=Diversispora epigaea TaxID=1348612 RepID=A0A397HA68_9GLOM|nr:hypothetical protein Glove_360g166 [Diversispora epigaea]